VETRLTQRHKIWSQSIKDSKLSYSETPETLFHLGSDRYWDVIDMTDRRTDRITVDNARYS